MATERAVRGQREEEPTRYGAWREGQRGRAPARPSQHDGDFEAEECDESEVRDSELGTVGLRLSRKDRERFTLEAKSEGVSLSEYLRAVLHDLEADPDLESRVFLKELGETKNELEAYAKTASKDDGGFMGYSTATLAENAVNALKEFCEHYKRAPVWSRF